MNVTTNSENSAMDSWDFENLEYLRRMIKNKQTLGENLPSTCPYDSIKDLRASFFVSGLEFESGFVTDYDIDEVIDEVCDDKIESLPTIQNENSFERDTENFTPVETNYLRPPLIPPLENCCLLEAITVSNASLVLSFGKSSQLNSIDELHSENSELSSSSLGSISEQGNAKLDSEKKKGFYDSMDLLMCSDYIKVEEKLSAVTGTNFPNFQTGKFVSQYYFGQFVEMENGSSLSSDCTEFPREMSTMRTPSPYYVRLRRDVLTPWSSFIAHPLNYGMDKDGQLLIDYSTNWDNLEKYVGNLIKC